MLHLILFLVVSYPLIIGLVSCNGFEQGIMEDMDIGVSDLSKIKYQMFESNTEFIPQITGHR